MTKTAVYPGSFDPITNGHLDIIERSSRVFEKIIVGVLENPEKKNPLFSVDERVDLIKRATQHLDNVEVESFRGLLIDYMHRKNAQVIVKGLRAISDFEYEFQMALMNNKLDSNVETLFMMTNSMYSYISSTSVKQVATFGGCIEDLVPESIIKDIKNKVAEVKNIKK